MMFSVDRDNLVSAAQNQPDPYHNVNPAIPIQPSHKLQPHHLHWHRTYRILRGQDPVIRLTGS